MYPSLWVSDGLLLAETFATLCTAAVVLLMYRLLRAPNWKNAAGVGIACGLAILTRSELALFLPLLVLPAVLTIREISRRQRLRLAAIALLGAVILVAPWTVYNLTRFERPVLLSTGEGGVLAGANCDDTYAGTRIGYWDGFCGVGGRGDASVLNEARRDQGLEYMRHHFDRVPVVIAARVGRMWGVFRPMQMAELSEIEGRPTWVSLSGWMMFWPLAALGVWGGVLLRRRGIRLLPLIAPLVVATIIAAVFYGLLRFRAPAEVSLVLLGGVGADAVLARVPRFRRADAARPDSPDGRRLIPEVRPGKICPIRYTYGVRS